MPRHLHPNIWLPAVLCTQVAQLFHPEFTPVRTLLVANERRKRHNDQLPKGVIQVHPVLVLPIRLSLVSLCLPRTNIHSYKHSMSPSWALWCIRHQVRSGRWVKRWPGHDPYQRSSSSRRGDKDFLFDETLVRVLWTLFPSRPWPWAPSLACQAKFSQRILLSV